MPSCPECGHAISADSKFCDDCGAPISIDQTCRSCGFSLKPGAKFCPQCGERTAGDDSSVPGGGRRGSQPAADLPQPRSPHSGEQSYYKHPKIIIAVICVALLAASLLAYRAKTVHDDGEQRQSDLQAAYDTAAQSIAACLRDGASSIGAEVGEELEHELVVLAMAEFVDANGEPIPEQDATVVRPFVLSVLASPSLDGSQFDEAQAEPFVEEFVRCRGSSSPIRDAALEFRSWTEGGFGLDAWMRSQFPSSGLRAAYGDGGEAFDRNGSDALNQMIYVVCPHDFSEESFDVSTGIDPFC